jgi:hypothetical protein
LRWTPVTPFIGMLFLPQVYLHARPHKSVEELIVTTYLWA